MTQQGNLETGRNGIQLPDLYGCFGPLHARSV